MNILVANDDGINAVGIARLTEALSEVADVYVCAPHTQRSASSHSIVFREPIKIRKRDFKNAVFALEIEGTPADCVKLGIKVLEDCGIHIDMVFSGINHGGNLGTDTIYSGTVAAAMEGSICGKPSVAVSVDSHDATCFDYACYLAVKCAQKAFGNLDEHTMLNINTPDLPAEEIKGTRITSLGRRDYDPWFDLVEGTEGDIENINLSYRYAGVPVCPDEDDCIDAVAVAAGYASITPLKHDLTAYDMIDEVKDWRLI